MELKLGKTKTSEAQNSSAQTDSILNDLDVFTVTDEAHNNPIQKKPKDLLKQFLMESQEDEPYLFVLNGTYSTAESFIHKMRVELSRFRTKIREMGKHVKRFKVLVISIVPMEDGKCEITLMRTMKTSLKAQVELSDDIVDILTHVTGEK